MALKNDELRMRNETADLKLSHTDKKHDSLVDAGSLDEGHNLPSPPRHVSNFVIFS